MQLQMRCNKCEQIQTWHCSMWQVTIVIYVRPLHCTARSYNGHKMGWVARCNNFQLKSRVKCCKQSMCSLASNQSNIPCMNNSYRRWVIRDVIAICLLHHYLPQLSILHSLHLRNSRSYLHLALANFTGFMTLLRPEGGLTQPFEQPQQTYKKEHFCVSQEQSQIIRRAVLLHLICQKLL